jgi:hypothetical protein
VDRTYYKFKKHTAIIKAVEQAYNDLSNIKDDADPIVQMLSHNFIVEMLQAKINIIRSQPKPGEFEQGGIMLSHDESEIVIPKKIKLDNTSQ